MRIKESVKEHKFPLLLMILTLIFYSNLIFNPGKGFSPFEDTIAVNYFFENVLRSGLDSQGSIPLWNNFYLGGMPFVGNSLAPLFFPLSLIALLMQANLYISYSFVIHTFLAGLFTYLFMREIGAKKFASFFSAIAFMFSSLIVIKIYPGHWTNMMVISLMPLVFLMMERMLKVPTLLNSVTLGLVWGLDLLAGNLHFFFFVSLALFIYYIVRLVQISFPDFKKSIKPILYAGLALIICICLSAVYLLPSYELSTFALRKGGIDFEGATYFSLPFQHLLHFIIPDFFGSVVDGTYWGAWINPWGFTCYVGVITLILALFGFIYLKAKRSLPFIILAVFSLFFSFGRYFPFYKLVYYTIPWIKMFRNPGEQLFIFAFAVCVMAGFGLILISDKFLSKRKSAKFIAITIITLSVIAFLVSISAVVFKPQILSIGENMARVRYDALHPGGLDFQISYMPKLVSVYTHIVNGLLWFSIISLATSALILMKMKSLVSERLFLLGAVTILIVDVFSYGIPYVAVRSPSSIYMGGEVGAIISNDNGIFRVYDIAGYIPQQADPVLGIEEFAGYDPSIIYDYTELTNILGGFNSSEITGLPIDGLKINKIKEKKILDLMNVKYIVSREPANDSRYELVYSNPKYIEAGTLDHFMAYTNATLPAYIYKNNGSLDRAFMVHDIKIISDRKEILNEIASPGFDPKKTAIIEKDLTMASTTTNSTDSIKIIEYLPDKIVIEVENEEPGMLVLSNVWYPGWYANDGLNRYEVYRTDYTLQGIYLEEGTHKITFTYNPLGYKLGMLISGITLILIIIYYIVLIMSHKALKEKRDSSKSKRK